jgi:hypothetical protein
MSGELPSDQTFDGQPPVEKTEKPRTTRGAFIWLHWVVIIVFGASLCFQIWGRTGEIILDFGNELYVSWQLSVGKVLFRDVAYLYGPLSPTVNAAVMKLLGPGLDSILYANLLVLCLTTALLHWLLRSMAGLWTALIGTLFFLGVFALAATARITNYNFLTPYAHGATHGFLLCLGMIACVDLFHRRGSLWLLFLGGLLTGLALLTKPEIFVGCAASFWLSAAVGLWLHGSGCVAKTIAIGALGMILPPALALFYFVTRMPIGTALGGVLGGWQFIGKPYVISTPFYRGSLGIDDAAGNLALMLEYAVGYTLVFSAIALLAILSGRRLPKRRWATTAIAISCGLIAYGLVDVAAVKIPDFWINLSSGMPVFAVFVVVQIGVRLLKYRKGLAGRETRIIQTGARPDLLQWSMAVLALTLLAKIFLRARIYQYGFVLAAPCAMMAVVASTCRLPGWVRHKGGSPLVVQLAVTGLLSAVVVSNQKATRTALAERTVPVPLAFGGSAYAIPRDSAMMDAIRWLSHRRGTLAVIPDAAGINYAANRPGSVPYNELNLMVLSMYGEPNVVRAFDQNPPRCILLMNADERTFGAQYFGRDYGFQLSRWISQHYHRVAVFPRSPLPLEVWERNADHFASSHS